MEEERQRLENVVGYMSSENITGLMLLQRQHHSDQVAAYTEKVLRKAKEENGK